jgi:hypothetical protein
MYTPNQLEKFLFFDIETAGITSSFEELLEFDPRIAKLWEKRCKWLKQNSGEEYQDYDCGDFWKIKASLHPEFSKVVCISFGAYHGDEMKIQSFVGEEYEILNNTNKVFNNAISKAWKLGGHTIKNFDIPFVGKRMIINKIDLAPLVGADLSVMDRDARKMRNARPFIFTNLKALQGVSEIADFIVQQGGITPRAAA